MSFETRAITSGEIGSVSGRSDTVKPGRFVTSSSPFRSKNVPRAASAGMMRMRLPSARRA